MSVDERRRLELADAVKRALGDDAGITLMELLPPVGWADVATKQDLLVLRGDIDRLSDDFGDLRTEFRDLRGEFNDLRGEFGTLRGEFNDLRGEFGTLRGEFNDLRGEFGTLHGEFGTLRGEFKDLEVHLEQKFREMLVSMMQLVIGGFLVAIVAIVASAFIR